MDNLKDIAAERAVLAALFQHGHEAYLDIADFASVNTMTLGSNQNIFACLEHVFAHSEPAKVDLPSVLSAAQTLGLSDYFKSQTERKHLSSVMSMPVQLDTARKLAGKIRKLEIARLLGERLEEARTALGDVRGDEPIDKILNTVEGPILDFTSALSDTGNKTIKMGDGALELYQHLMDNPTQEIGIPSGFKRWDRANGGGLRRNSVNVIAARAKMGKSAIGDRICLNVAQAGHPVINLDTEMSQEEHLMRLGAMLTGLRIWDIERGLVGTKEDQRRALTEGAKRLADMPYYYRCVSGEAFEESLSHVRRWLKKTVGTGDDGRTKPCVVVYDYLKLMTGDMMSGGMAEYQALGFIATALKNFVSRHSIASIAMAQLNRSGMEVEDETAMSQSDRVVWFCTSMTIFKRKKKEELEENKEFSHKLVHVLARGGESLPDGDYINLKCDFSTGLIQEGPTYSELLHSGQTDRSIINEPGEAVRF